MTSTECNKARVAPKRISSNRLLGSVKEAAAWPGSDRNTVVTLALLLVAARADADGSTYFADLSERNPADALVQALAGFFAIRAGRDVAAAVTRLDEAAPMEPGLPRYFRGLAMAESLPLGEQAIAVRRQAEGSSRCGDPAGKQQRRDAALTQPRQRSSIATIRKARTRLGTAAVRRAGGRSAG